MNKKSLKFWVILIYSSNKKEGDMVNSLTKKVKDDFNFETRKKFS